MLTLTIAAGILLLPMRDDIHKSAPVGRAWRSFMKHCAREADRKERAHNSALGALIDDCTRELSPQFIACITEKFTDPQKKLFNDSLGEAAAAYRVKNPSHVLEQDVIANLQRREACGQTGKEAVADAVTDALVRRRESQLRAMKGHWLKQGGAGVAQAIGAAEKVLKKMPIAKLVSQALEGRIDKKSLGCSKTEIDLDEDLRGGGNGDPD
jgi:hypothetical protein